MARALRFLFALLAVLVLVFAFAPDPAPRHLPVPEPEPVPSGGGTLVVDLVPGAAEAQLAEVAGLLGVSLDWVHPSTRRVGLAHGEVPDLAAAIALLDGHPLVKVAEPEMQIDLASWPNDPLYERQWHLKAMGAPAGWAQSPRGRGVVVAVIDTGVAPVEDLDPARILPGKSFVPTESSPVDLHGHGTHVAGTIAQTTHNGVGVAGVAPEAKILPVKVLSRGGFGMSQWIAAGIDYAAAEGADVINLSLGGGYSRVIHNAVRRARAKGVIVVAAAGNTGRQGVSYPGGLEETIGVSATGPDGALAFYSSWGKGVDIAAPGGDKRKPGGGVLQNTIDGRGGQIYAEFQGTSMASPHVAGAAAVLLSKGLPPDVVQDMLLRHARGSGAWDPKLGHGHLDLGAALGTVLDRHAMLRFGLGALLALLVTGTARLRTGWRVWAMLLTGAVAGGLFFLRWLPLPDLAVVELLSRAFLLWPGQFLGSWWVGFPLWLSALVPFVVSFTLGAFRGGRPLAFGLACGVGAHLLHGAATGTLAPWLMPGALGTLWLGANGIACVVLALALAGAEKLDAEKAR